MWYREAGLLLMMGWWVGSAPPSRIVDPSPHAPAATAAAPPLWPQGDIARLRDAYDAFLAEWPLCFGYWKKYAAAELRAGEAERAAQVFERGVAAVPYRCVWEKLL